MSFLVQSGAPGPYTRRPVWEQRNHMDFEDEARRAAAVVLAGLMSDISEECWCAGWLLGVESDLWEMAADTGPSPVPWGQGVVSADDRAALRSLASIAGGWVEWGGVDACLLDGSPREGVRFVPWGSP